MAEAFGLVFQLDAMNHDGPAWRNSDMSIDQVQRRLDQAGAEGGAVPVNGPNERDGSDPNDPNSGVVPGAAPGGDLALTIEGSSLGLPAFVSYSVILPSRSALSEARAVAGMS